MIHQLTEWAAAFTIPDPMPAASESLDCDPAVLSLAFAGTRQACRGVRQGTSSLAEVENGLVTGWSAPEPRAAVGALLRACWSTTAILQRQAEEVERTRSVLDSCRTEMRRALTDTETAIRQAGFGLDGAQHAGVALGDAWRQEGAVSPRPAVEAFAQAALVNQQRVRATLAELGDALSIDPTGPVRAVQQRTPVLADAPRRETPQDRAVELAEQDNMARLQDDLGAWWDPDRRRVAQGIRNALDEAAARGEKATLLIYESAAWGGQGRAAVAVGDVATAAHTTVTVPGILNEPGDMNGALVDAGNLQRQSEWAGEGETAVVAWFGYQIPGSALMRAPGLLDVINPLPRAVSVATSLLSAGNDDAAVAGGEQLVEDMSVLRGFMPDDVVVTGAGFSMGSTTVSQAAKLEHVFDALVLMGSPGAGEGVRSTADYPGLDREDVWVNALENDPVTGHGPDLLGYALAVITHDYDNLVPFGAAPDNPGFDAQVMDLPSPANDHGLGLGNHTSTNYLTGPLLGAVGGIAAGRPESVPLRRTR